MNVKFKENWQQRNQQVKAAVCELLGWTELEYCNYEYSIGIAYLIWYFPYNEQYRKQLEESKLYWAWFKNHYLLYDESFISYKRGLSECSQQTRWLLYNDLHNPHTMVMEKKLPTILQPKKQPEVFKLKIYENGI